MEAVMEFAVKRSLVAVGLMLVAFSVSPTVAFAKVTDAKIDVTRAEYDAMAAQVEGLTQALAAETAAREAAETALQNAIGVEESSRIVGDNNEASARAAADAALQASIGAEASARTAGDDNEASARAIADAFLQLQMDDLLEDSGAPGIVGVTVRTERRLVAAGALGLFAVTCLDNEVATGGGFSHTDDPTAGISRGMNLWGSKPSGVGYGAPPTRWMVQYSNYSDAVAVMDVYVVCAELASDGGSAGAGGAGGAP
jgi:hypothetical protein